MGRDPGDGSRKTEFDFEAVGPKNMYLMYHEELESLAKFVPELERARFWMTFGDAYITHLTVLQNVGMTSIEPITLPGQGDHPAAVPRGGAAQARHRSARRPRARPTSACIATGEALDGSGEKTFYIKNICDHEDAYEETGNQAVSYTTGVPAMIGAAMMLTGKWAGEGVFNMEQFDPDPFMDMLNSDGLPWTGRGAGAGRVRASDGNQSRRSGRVRPFRPRPRRFARVRGRRGEAARQPARCSPTSATRRTSRCSPRSRRSRMWSVAPIIGEYLDGVCTSGLWEARLASEFYDGEIATYCAPTSPTTWPRSAACRTT